MAWIEVWIFSNWMDLKFDSFQLDGLKFGCISAEVGENFVQGRLTIKIGFVYN